MNGSERMQLALELAAAVIAAKVCALLCWYWMGRRPRVTAARHELAARARRGRPRPADVRAARERITYTPRHRT